jgi:hypothetical protein
MLLLFTLINLLQDACNLLL